MGPYILRMHRPTQEYLDLCAEPITFADEADDGEKLPRKLVILDLNGTLCSRGERARSRTKPKCRPGLTKFLRYLFSEFHVMVWSSSTAQSVETMSGVVFSPQQRKSLIASWARDTLRLTDEQFYNKVQTYKNLEWIWEDEKIQKFGPFSQKDTIIIDDTRKKMEKHPYNLIEVPEFDAASVNASSDKALDRVQVHLDKLRRCDNVSAYLAQVPLGLESAHGEQFSPVDDIEELTHSFETHFRDLGR